ncbi:peptidoglycan-binding domain-containing protein [Humibacillus xanthopallidus]|uniref:Peptidoglycan hydrolase-like protein with peptidoglycan-binding domain n=1 Tax=Humibacillus xanthopallidus TaxID=412689 RepID=A0A543I2U7_9MICO|nr:peptidoglycan-binding protein [Humibacillus xanthopallidus]TQM64905.1 peptidoglycan hydrolase-like protein with peptidoglycan-binding domain [Humibacillus xanthopallidus]
MARRTTPASTRRHAAAGSGLAVVMLLGTLTACGTSPAPPSSASAVTATADAVGPDASVTTATRSVTSAGQASTEPAHADVQGECERTLTAYPVLEPGAKGPAVRALQCFLDDADYGPVIVDGVYGRQTRAAVARVESGFEGAPPHPGRIDRGMWVLLISRALGTATLREGATGPEVTTLQRALRAAGGTLEVDGVFGPQTRRAVTQFQKANSITADGVVGEETYFFLKSGGVTTRG